MKLCKFQGKIEQQKDLQNETVGDSPSLSQRRDFMEYNIGDIVRTKKQHPCGSKIWEITRVGVDFKLKCQGCGHVVMLPREKALKAITKKIEN